MPLFIIFVLAIILFLFTSSIFYFFYKKRDNTKIEKGEEIEKIDWFSKGLLLLAFFILIFSLISPFLFTREPIDNGFIFSSQTGYIGDTIGGIMNPFISIVGVIVTGLAFYMQFKANKLQRELFNKEIDKNKEQFEFQKFESKLYEMLRIHRDNVSDFRIEGYDFEEKSNHLNQPVSLTRYVKDTIGRKVFVTMHTELECIIKIYKIANNITTIDKKGYNLCYEVFFGGLRSFQIKFPQYTQFIHYLTLARRQHNNDLIPTNKSNFKRKTFNGIDLNFNYKPFSGHSSRLGHYFRQLFLIVKTVVFEDSLKGNDELKLNYLRLLRAQLTNHEQILLFYNWLNHDFGGNWENKQNAFFSKFKMIHNLWYNLMLQDNYILEKIDWIRKKGDDVFEIG